MGSISLNIRLGRFTMKLTILFVIFMIATMEGCLAGVFNPNPKAYEISESINIIARNESCIDIFDEEKCKEKKENKRCSTENMKTNCALTCGHCNVTTTITEPTTVPTTTTTAPTTITAPTTTTVPTTVPTTTTTAPTT